MYSPSAVLRKNSTQFSTSNLYSTAVDLINNEKYDEAIKLLNQAISQAMKEKTTAEQYADYYAALGLACLKLYRSKKAGNIAQVAKEGLQSYDFAIDKFPHDRSCWYNRALLKFETGDSLGALKDVNEAVRLNNLSDIETEKLKDNALYLNLRVLLKFDISPQSALSDSNDAIGSAEKVKDFDLKFLATLYLNRARVREKLNDLKGALSDYNKAVDLNGTKENLTRRANYFGRLGLTYARNGDYEAAIETFLEAIEKEPKNHQHIYNLAIVYELKKDFKKAIEYVQEALNLASNNENYKKALNEIKQNEKNEKKKRGSMLLHIFKKKEKEEKVDDISKNKKPARPSSVNITKQLQEAKQSKEEEKIPGSSKEPKKEASVKNEINNKVTQDKKPRPSSVNLTQQQKIAHQEKFFPDQERNAKKLVRVNTALEELLKEEKDKQTGAANNNDNNNNKPEKEEEKREFDW